MTTEQESPTVMESEQNNLTRTLTENEKVKNVSKVHQMKVITVSFLLC